MTKEELSKYIDSLNKEKGEFTEDEIYAIGMKFKELPKADKSWQELADTLGWHGSSESLRCYVKGRSASEGTLPKNKREINSRTIEDVTEEDLADAKRDFLRKQQQFRDERNSYYRIVREEARVDSMKQAIRETVSQLNALPKAKAKEFECNDGNEAILMFSDLHIGVDCDNFYNTYNKDIAMKRVLKLAKDVTRYCTENKVEILNVVNLGDAIHGIIHTSARIEQERDVISQVMIASEIIATALNVMQNAAPRIVYRSCSDNHSRLNANKEESIENENFGRLIDWYLHERLAGTSIEFADDNIDYSLGKFKLLNGKNVMFAHGHLDSKTNVIQNYMCATKEFIDYVLLGHFHSSSSRSFHNSKLYINGSIVGTEEYALSKRLFSEPCQTLLVFRDGNEIEYSIKLNINK